MDLTASILLSYMDVIIPNVPNLLGSWCTGRIPFPWQIAYILKVYPLGSKSPTLISERTDLHTHAQIHTHTYILWALVE